MWDVAAHDLWGAKLNGWENLDKDQSEAEKLVRHTNVIYEYRVIWTEHKTTVGVSHPYPKIMKQLKPE